ncbi:hypothetical protein [Methanobrevibacter curvatus]|uniref:Uncharacterized protein n=1 Tax=Methanobrevibacter curvatus TaxID=49547 RepID=A0A166A4U1_9EURY|nr:hypothetical protein [Methanobrevibacter curvatus]KZX11569.1 hypothetical protein MBCUR_13860 [Methanobrevibacter curvatus]
MIDDRIKLLRKAAQVSTEESSDKLWCVVAGNEELMNEIVYSVISSKKRVEILFREHIIIKESFGRKKFDFLMLWGDTDKIDELSYLCKESGGSYIKIAPYYIKKEPNLMLMVGPDNAVKKFVSNVEKVGNKFSILLDDETTGFIETDFNMATKLPKFIKKLFEPLFNMSDVILTTILISAKTSSDVEEIKKLSRSYKIFVIDFQEMDD